jgi:cardiolipin synthase
MKIALVIIGLVLTILILLYVDFQLGRKKHMQLAKKSESPIFNGQLDIIPHGQELIADFFKELKAAKSHIHVLFYIVKSDKISQEFFEILKRKASEGIEVRLLLDRLGSIKADKKELAALKSAGAEFGFTNRIRFPFLFYSSQVRNHRKISIIDGEIGYLGGFNIAKEYIDQDPKLSPWRDYHLKITGEGVSFLQREFLKDWKEYAGIDLLRVSSYFQANSSGNVKHQFKATEAGLLEDVYLKLFRESSSSITIGTPYFIPSERIFAELLKAIQRGVEVTILVPSTSDHILVKEASYPYLRPLLKAGAKVFQFKNGFYHAKTAIIDDMVCDVGTANFDKRSFFLNKEINCYVYNRAFVERLRDVINKDLLDSKPLLLADLTKPNLFRSFKESIAGAVSYFL